MDVVMGHPQDNIQDAQQAHCGGSFGPGTQQSQFIAQLAAVGGESVVQSQPHMVGFTEQAGDHLVIDRDARVPQSVDTRPS